MFRMDVDNFKKLVYAGKESARMDVLMVLNFKFVPNAQTDPKDIENIKREGYERKRLIVKGLNLIALKASLDVHDSVFKLL